MKITKRQLAALLFTIIPASRFLLLPSVYAQRANQDIWFAGLINTVLDALLLAAMLVILKKLDGKNLYEVLTEKLGKVAAKCIYLFYGVYFLLKGIVPLFEQRNFTEITLYETAPTVLTFLPFFLVSLYACLKGLNALSRAGEIIMWFTAIGLALVVFLSVGSANPYYLMPILKNPLKRTISASYYGLIWYGQPIILLFLSGCIRRDKHFNLHVCLSFAAASLVCILLFAVFTGIYGDVAVRQIYALTRMTKYSVALSNVGRFDYVATILLNASSVLALTVPLFFSCTCLTRVFPKCPKPIIPLVVNGVTLVIMLIFKLRFLSVAEVFEKFFTPIMFISVYIAPLPLLFIRKPAIHGTSTKKDERNRQSIYNKKQNKGGQMA